MPPPEPLNLTAPPDWPHPSGHLAVRAGEALAWLAMCGIVGYAGGRQALDVVLEGLRRLEYRGYDSAGIAVLADGTLVTEKRAGKLANLVAALDGQPPLPGTVGLGHTRWATHGAPNDPNAHPHTDCADQLAVVHNGIIENFATLRREISARHHLASDTDTEVVAHLLEDEMAAQAEAAARAGTAARAGAGALAEAGQAAPGALAEAMRRVCQRLDGAFTLVAVDVRDPGAVVGARRNSPLVIGRGHGENFLASDVAAFIAYTRDAIELGQDQVAEVRADGVTVTDVRRRPREDHRVPRELGYLRRGKGGLRVLHAQGDRRAAPRGRRHAARPDRPRTASSPSTRCAWTTPSCAASTRSSWWPAAPPTTPG